jgi:hypothetical protein
MNYLMAPLERHYDNGFGATALAFYDAAKVLRDQPSETVLLTHLPQNFLLRHALELYLKSGIVIVHRRLKIPFGEGGSHDQPMVCVNDVWKRFNQVHSIRDLFKHWKEIIERNKEVLRDLSTYKPNWSVPEELDSAIDTIDETDHGGTYYRYPVTREGKSDREKASFKETPREVLFSEASLVEGHPTISMIVENEDGEFVRAFQLDRGTEKRETQALLTAADILDSFHAMMRMELTDGW